MIIEKEGTISFWFDKKKNPLVFTKVGNVNLLEFTHLNDLPVVIRTESTILSIVMHPNTEKEIVLIQCEVTPSPELSKHMVTFTWSKNELCLYFDAQLIKTVNTAEIENAR